MRKPSSKPVRSPRWLTGLAGPALASLVHAAPLPSLGQLPLTFVFNDLLTVENQRYRVEALVNGSAQPLAGSRVDKTLTPLPVPSSDVVPETFFQFSITDGARPIRQYAVFVGATQERCSLFRLESALQLDTLPGRVMEIYALLTLPESQVVPQRTEPQRVCTAENGRLIFHFKPPLVDAFQIKVQNALADGRANNVLDLFVPTSFNALLGEAR